MKLRNLCTICILLLSVSCVKEPGPDPSRRPDGTYQPNLSPTDFRPINTWRNQFIALEGQQYIYEGSTEDGVEHIEVVRVQDSIEISGTYCAIFSEQSSVNGTLEERVEEFLAEDQSGNVWILGVSVDNFNSEGVIINHHGSWTAGFDGAKPGVMMPANPEVGMKYRQEYYFNISENQAEVIETGVTIATPMATFHDCIVIREWSELEPDIFELKMYAPGVGLVKEINLSTGEEIALIDIR